MRTARRVASTVIGVGLLVASAGALAARYVPIPGHRTLYVVVASPYLLLGAPVAFLVLLWGRHRALAIGAGLLTAALVVLQLPWYLPATSDSNEVAVRAMTVNMLYGQADPTAVVRTADDRADIVMVQELTPDAVRYLTAAGIGKTFPHQVLDARTGSAGVGIYSRYPIAQQERIGGYQLAMVSARLRVPEVTRDPTVLSIHLDAPWPRPIDGWQGDIAKFPTTLADVAHKADGGAVIVGGDFNSTIDMKQFRDLLTDGYRDAAEQAGGGRELTYPANRRIPPFMGIDHILTRASTATSTATVEIAGTDHLAVIATVMVPRG